MGCEAYNLIQVPDGKVSAKTKGRIGNQMFIDIAAMTYAKRTGREFIGVVRDYQDSAYDEWMDKTILRNIKYTTIDEIKDFFIDRTNGWLCNGFPNTEEKNVCLDDFFQDARCIDKDIAYEMFKPRNGIIEDLYSYYGDVSDCVCVNIRRGDYLQIREYGFNVYSKEEIEKIIDTFFKHDKILFVSDDIKWCKENFNGEKYRFADRCEDRIEMEKAELDLYLQTLCKSNVISNSTFSWWGAFLNEHSEKVVCHWSWFSDDKIDEMKYVLPDNWIKFAYGQLPLN